MSATITQTIAGKQSSYIPRVGLGIVIGLVVTLFLFWFMQYMIETAVRALYVNSR